LLAADAQADGISLAGSLWTCTRAKDRSKFVITFYPGGGVGGGEIQDVKVNPYVFDASQMRSGRWPGHWQQRGQHYTWSFPDQHMRITGMIRSPGQPPSERLIGTEASMAGKTAVSCVATPKLPPIGEGLVIPRDGHFMDVESGQGTLKVPVGISIEDPGSTR